MKAENSGNQIALVKDVDKCDSHNLNPKRMTRDELKDLNNRFFGSKSLAVFQDPAEVWATLADGVPSP